MKIRTATSGDAESIAAIGQCVWIDTYATDGVRTSLSTYANSKFLGERIASDMGYRKFDVFELRDHLVGYAEVFETEERLELESLYILPKFQGLGFGRQYLRYLQSNNRNIVLSCWERNIRAIGFYEALGFVETGETYFELDKERHRNVLFTFGT